MLPKGAAKKVTVYLNEDTRRGMEPLWKAVVDFLHHKQITGATVSRPTMGFGSHKAIHSGDSEYTMNSMPVRIEFIETPKRTEDLLPTLYDMVTDGLIEIQDTVIVKSVEKGRAPVSDLPRAEMKGPAKLVRIYMGEADKYDDEPLYEAILKRLRMRDTAGATVYRGLLGYGAKGHTHKGGLLSLSKDLPIMISVIEKSEKVEELLTLIQPLLQDGMIVLSDVNVYRVVSQIPEAAQ